MADVTEIEALKASVRGARSSADALATVAASVEATDPHGDVSGADLDDLQRLTLANAIAAQALRGLVETMLKRRGKIGTVAADAEDSGADERGGHTQSLRALRRASGSKATPHILIYCPAMPAQERSRVRRIGGLTGGGDAPGLTAVIRAVVKAAASRNCEVIGLEDRFDGLIEANRSRRLVPQDVNGILRVGRTILRTAKRGQPV